MKTQVYLRDRILCPSINKSDPAAVDLPRDRFCFFESGLRTPYSSTIGGTIFSIASHILG